MCEKFFKKFTDVCHHLLLHDDDLLRYLKDKRGLTDGSINTNKLGAFPKDFRRFYEHGLDPKELREQNIIWNAEQSQFKLYPVVIPIFNVYGKPIAIGCRTLLSEEERKKIGIPKYRNSSYKKTYHLFGLNQAYNAIRKENQAFVVEGYFDVMTAHQKGIKNVVATCGTMFSDRQLMILSRYTNRVCLLFDNDEAGRLSSSRVMNDLKNTEGVTLKCKFTPDKCKDLDEYLRQGGNIDFFREERINFYDVEIEPLW